MNELDRLGLPSLVYFKLDESGNPVPCSFEQWTEWFNTDERLIAQETVGQFWVSTVFLSPHFTAPGYAWETMIFPEALGSVLREDGSPAVEYQTRCYSKHDVSAMHKRAVDLAWRSFVADPQGPLLEDDEDEEDMPVEHS